MLFGIDLFECADGCKTTFLKDSKVYVDAPNIRILKDCTVGNYGIVQNDVMRVDTLVENLNLLNYSDFFDLDDEAVKEAWHLEDYGDSSWYLGNFQNPSTGEERYFASYDVDGSAGVSPYIEESFFQNFTVGNDADFQFKIEALYSLFSTNGYLRAYFLKDGAVEVELDVAADFNIFTVPLEAGDWTLQITYYDEVASVDGVRRLAVGQIYLEGLQTTETSTVVGKLLDLTEAQEGCYLIQSECGGDVSPDGWSDFEIQADSTNFVNNKNVFITNTDTEDIVLRYEFESCGGYSIDLLSQYNGGDFAVEDISYSINGGDKISSFTSQDFSVETTGSYVGTVVLEIFIKTAEGNTSNEQQITLTRATIETGIGDTQREELMEFCVAELEQCTESSILDIELTCKKFSTPVGARYVMPVDFYAEPTEVQYTSEEYVDVNGAFKRTTSRDFKTLYSGLIQEVSMSAAIALGKLLATEKVVLTHQTNGKSDTLFFTGNSVSIVRIPDKSCYDVSAVFLIEEENSSDCCC